MKAALISPAASQEDRINLIDVEPDVSTWERHIGADWIGHQTLSSSPDLMAIVDDAGQSKKLPVFTVFAPDMHARIELSGPTLIIASNDEAFIDVTDADLRLLDVKF